MMNLAEYRRTATRLADFCPGPRWSPRASCSTRTAFSARRVSAALIWTPRSLPNWSPSPAAQQRFPPSRIGLGIFVEAQRRIAYPADLFPDAASALVDAERKADFEEAGAHFESGFSSPSPICRRPRTRARRSLALRGRTSRRRSEILNGFVDRTDRVLALLDGFMPECLAR
jgi:type IV secretion system protein VirB4